MKRWMKGFYGKNCNFNNRLHARRGLWSGGDSLYEYLLKEQLVGDASEARADMYDWVESRVMREALPRPRVGVSQFAREDAEHAVGGLTRCVEQAPIARHLERAQ